jgi:hypothetical protein
VQCGGGWRGGLPLLPITIPIQTTTPNTAANKPLYLKLPMYLFFYMGLILKGFDVGKSITWALEGVGPGNQDFFGPKWYSLCSLSFQGQKKSRFPKPTLPMPLVMDVACLKTITYHFI